MRFTSIAILLAATCAVSGCQKPEKAAVRQWALYYVDRIHDTAPPESTDTPAADSLVLDSVTAAWTTDEWIRFWREVEKEQARRREAALRLAEAESKAEAEREAAAQADSGAAPDSVPAADST